MTDLDRVGDLFDVDVASELATGVVVPGDGVPTGDPLVFYEVSELCQPVEEGGSDPLICVRKSRADVVIRTSADPTRCN